MTCLGLVQFQSIGSRGQLQGEGWMSSCPGLAARLITVPVVWSFRTTRQLNTMTFKSNVLPM